MIAPLNLDDLLVRLHPAMAHAGRMALKDFRRPAHVSKKPDGSQVSKTDTDIQAHLLAGLKGLLDGPIIAEEHQAHLSFRDARQSTYVWTVDPIDGTDNFLAGNPLFSVAVGLLKNSSEGLVPALGAVLAPALGEYYFGTEQASFRAAWPGETPQPMAAPGSAGLVYVNQDFLDKFAPKGFEERQALRVTASTALNIVYAACFGRAAFFSGSLWDWGAALAVAAPLGAHAHHLDALAPKSAWSSDDFRAPPKPWALHTRYILCRPADAKAVHAAYPRR